MKGPSQGQLLLLPASVCSSICSPQAQFLCTSGNSDGCPCIQEAHNAQPTLLLVYQHLTTFRTGASLASEPSIDYGLLPVLSGTELGSYVERHVCGKLVTGALATRFREIC
jgi:hypothetical protein